MLAINVSQMHDKLGCWFDGRVMGVVYDHASVVARIRREIWSDRGLGGERFSSKLRNSRNKWED